MAENLRLEYHTQLAMAKEEDGELKATVFLQNSSNIKAQRRLFRNIRRLEGKAKGGSTFKLTNQV